MRADAAVQRVALLVADGAPVDWEAVIARAETDQHGRLRQLRLLSTATLRVLGARASEPTEGMDRLAALLQPVLWCAAVKCLLALIGYAVRRRAFAGETIPIEMWVLVVLAFGSAAAVLLYGGARDRRALHLGGFFLLIASSFSDRPLRGLPLLSLASALRSTPVEAFLGAYLWLFVWRFPEMSPFSRAQRAARTMAYVAAGLGVLLLGANLALAAMEPRNAFSVLLAFFDRRADFVGGYWLSELLVAGPALAFATWKARQARSDERRRIALFVWGIGIGLGPIMLASFLGLPFSPLRDLIYQQRWPIGIVLYAFLLTIPLTTASAVLVHHVLDVRALARRVLRYAFARSIIALAVVAPLAFLVRHVYLHRTESLANALFARVPLVLGGASILLWLVARKRGIVLSVLDRVFFREREDPRAQLARLGEGLRGAHSLREICSCLAEEVGAAMHPEEVEVLLRTRGGFRPWVAGGRPLVGNTALASILPHAAAPVPIDLERSSGVERLLPERERQWLADGSFRLLVPITASDGALLGIIALGERRSEMAYSKEDYLLLRAMAAAAAVAIAPRLAGGTGANRGVDVDDEPAGECHTCHTVMAAASPRCVSCGGPVANAALPHIVAGKLRVERRLGAGGMGVVYRALDLTLGRLVAVKTLPRVSAANSVRMRREARTMAAVTHPNLALIYGAETWRGTPILVVEHMAGGTLADRLREGPLSPLEAVRLAGVMAEVLGRLHCARILHRDVKPSNIGFLHGVAKLMDFGLAQLMHEGETPSPNAESVVVGNSADVATLRTLTRVIDSHTKRVVGTPLYLSPEAISGARPDPSFDLWALAMVLYECVAGVHPLRGGDVDVTFERIRSGEVPDVRTHRPSCPAGLADFLNHALARDRRERPSTAADFHNSLSRAG